MQTEKNHAVKQGDVVSSEIPQRTVGTELESIMENWYNEHNDRGEKVYLLF